MKRFKQLGVIASMQPTHCTTDMRFCEIRVGPERSKNAYIWKTLLDAGAQLAFGTDWPVEPLDPMRGLYSAVTRKNIESGAPEGGWFPEQRLTMADSVRLYTLGAAYASFEEKIKGSIEPGKLADFTVLSKDIYRVDPKEGPDDRGALHDPRRQDRLPEIAVYFSDPAHLEQRFALVRRRRADDIEMIPAKGAASSSLTTPIIPSPRRPSGPRSPSRSSRPSDKRPSRPELTTSYLSIQTGSARTGGFPSIILNSFMTLSAPWTFFAIDSSSIRPSSPASVVIAGLPRVRAVLPRYLESAGSAPRVVSMMMAAGRRPGPSPWSGH